MFSFPNVRHCHIVNSFRHFTCNISSARAPPIREVGERGNEGREERGNEETVPPIRCRRSFPPSSSGKWITLPRYELPTTPRPSRVYLACFSALRRLTEIKTLKTQGTRFEGKCTAISWGRRGACGLNISRATPQTIDNKSEPNIESCGLMYHHYTGRLVVLPLGYVKP